MPHGVRRALSLAKRFAFDRAARSEQMTLLTFRGAVHQSTTLSWPDRYPRLFAAARDLLADAPAPHLLSFGCSAGEEVLSLQHYFPDATVVGAEINRRQLRACNRLPPDAARSFIHSTPDAIAERGPYHAIFCMAVLTRRPHDVERSDRRNIARLYPFDRFANQVRFLVTQLCEGGLLVVEHSLYRVEDVADLPLEPMAGVGTYLAKGPRFDRTGTRIERQPKVSRIFRKRS